MEGGYIESLVLTLNYLIAEHALLTFFIIFSTLLALIRSCLLNYFQHFFHPALLMHPACLTIFKIFSTLLFKFYIGLL